MKIIYFFLTIITGIATLMTMFVQPVIALLLGGMAIISSILFFHLCKNDCKEALESLVDDISLQKNLLYHTEKGNISYEIDQKSITAHLHANGFQYPILSLTYNKKTGVISQTNKHELVSEEQSMRFKGFVFGKRQTQRPKQSKSALQSKENTLIHELQNIQAIRTELLERGDVLSIETRHLLEVTIPNDLERIQQLYLNKKEENKEENFLSLLTPIQEKIYHIQADLMEYHEHEFDKLAELLQSRYMIK